MKRFEKELEERDAKRDLGSELLDSVREMMADKRTREHTAAYDRHAARTENRTTHRHLRKL